MLPLYARSDPTEAFVFELRKIRGGGTTAVVITIRATGIHIRNPPIPLHNQTAVRYISRDAAKYTNGKWTQLDHQRHLKVSTKYPLH